MGSYTIDLKFMKIKKQNRTSLTVALTLLVISTILAIWFFLYANNPSRTDKDIDYSPATKDDKEFNDSIKESLPEKKEAQGSKNDAPDVTKTSVTPVISAWGQPGGPGTDLRVNGYVPGIIESDGTCTLRLTKDGEIATLAKASLQNAQNTSCGQLIIPYAQLSAGTWQAVLSYTSSSSEGSSTKTQIEVR